MCRMRTKTVEMGQTVPAPSLTARQVGERLQLSISTVYLYAVTGELPAVRIGKHWRFPAAAIEAKVRGTV